MAMARLALKQKNSVLVPCNKFIGEGLGGVQGHGWKYGLSMSSSSAESDGKEVAVQTDEEGGRNRNMSSRWRSLLPFRKPSSLWRRKDHARHTHPFGKLSNIYFCT